MEDLFYYFSLRIGQVRDYALLLLPCHPWRGDGHCQVIPIALGKCQEEQLLDMASQQSHKVMG